MSKAKSDVVSAVRDQYERFPYPPVQSIVEEDAARDLAPSFNLEHRLPAARALGPKSRIWVPGCGTRWAVMTALQFRGASILASDLSEASLARQKRLADSLGLKNIEFRRENLLEVAYKSEFDFVSCVGVLHHLPEPDRGFEVVARSLKPTGLLELMVYDTWNRRYSMRMQDILAAFDPTGAFTPDERFEVATRLLGSVTRFADVPPEVKRVLEYLHTETGFARELADFISHPMEHYYEVPTLIAALERVGLRVRSWKMPHLYDPDRLLGDDKLATRARAMPAATRAHLGHLLGSGLLECFAEPSSLPPAEHDAPVESRRVRAATSSLRHVLAETGEVLNSEPVEKLLRDGERFLFDGGERRPAVQSYSRPLDCIKEEERQRFVLADFGITADAGMIAAILAASQTPATLGEIADRVSAQSAFRRADVLTVCDRLCRTPFRLLLTV